MATSKSTPKQKYAAAEFYEKKIPNIAARLNITDVNHNYDRFGSWISFRYKGGMFMLEHSIDNAIAHGQKWMKYGSDTFAQLVMTLEDLARMVERGIYDLAPYIAGMRYLPPVNDIPSFFKTLGFEEVPEKEEQIHQRYRELSRKVHPDVNSSAKAAEDFQILTKAAEQAKQYLKGKK